ncbi:MAG TPA: hypothetical protein VHX14_18115 [Thermoanaerobaculia bacterium]|jgi:hypothetical protein|nr:hypothetical protein [Thermoanaerobaculia bacterium]
MLKVKQLGVAAAIALFAGAAMASNFRAADQVYIPAAGHIVGGSATFVSDVFISNLSDDSVDVSVIYATGNTTANAVQTPFPKVLTLSPRERRELPDFMLNTLHLSSAFGQVIFNGCLKDQDCTPNPTTGLNANYRNISVESRIYSFTNGLNQATAPTNGQLFSGIPWYNFVSESASAAGLDKVFITGVRNTPTFQTNVGFVNASQFSTTTLTAKLFLGSAPTTVVATASFTLPPLGFQQSTVGASNLFGSLIPNATTSTNYFITVEQGNTQKVVGGANDADANGCPTGCPAFFAYGSQLDRVTQDATTLEAQYNLPLTNNAITCIYAPDLNTCTGKVGGGIGGIHRAAKHQL